MLVCGQEFNDQIIARIDATIESEPEISRRSLARRVCKWLDWKAPNGNLKDMSARSALLILHRRGAITLPEAGKNNLFVSAEKKEPTDIPYEIHNAPLTVDQLGEIELVPVSSRNRGASHTWNGLMNKFHPLGAGPLCGAQMRYLIKSANCGYIGGLAFSAAAWRLGARDSWIGWDDDTRRKNLQKIICNSRFLLLPKVPNLASHILARCLKVIPKHWHERYNINPVLVETYVERDTHRGVCYRAANWLHIGATKGRGRMDKTRTARLSVKDVYVFPLVENPSKALCNDAPLAAKPPGNDPPRAPRNWAEEEFGKVDLQDQRLTKRLVHIAQDMYARPQANIPQACQTRARAKAAYRFFAHPVTKMDKIIEQHYEQTLCRAATQSVVLTAQDTTTLNYSTHDQTEGIGPIGSTLPGPIGLLLHDTMAFNEAGTPLGLLDVQLWARDPEQFGKKHLRHQLPIEEKESSKW
ncbi:MAG: Druantia anti-phage system protein DruA, partial [Candidatus Diapherotrites archaeon]